MHALYLLSNVLFKRVNVLKLDFFKPSVLISWLGQIQKLDG